MVGIEGKREMRGLQVYRHCNACLTPGNRERETLVEHQEPARLRTSMGLAMLEWSDDIDILCRCGRSTVTERPWGLLKEGAANPLAALIWN